MPDTESRSRSRPGAPPVAAFDDLAGNERFAAFSPVASRLSAAVAHDPGLAAAVAGRTGSGDAALPYLLFAAVHHVLQNTAPDHPLAAYYATLGGTRPPDDGLEDAFRALVSTHADLLHRLCAEPRQYRSNDPEALALLRLALGRAARVAGTRPLALVELGTAAGLCLVPDLVGYRYGDRALDTDRPLVLNAELHLDPASPEGVAEAAGRGDVLAPLPPVAGRHGIDLDPVRLDDPDELAWLRACPFPEHAATLTRMDAAVPLARAAGSVLHAGDLATCLPTVLAGLPDDVLPVVYGSSVLCSVSADVRLQVRDAVLHAGREVAWILSEATVMGHALVSADPGPFGEDVRTLELVHADGSGGGEVTALAAQDPASGRIDWSPRRVRPAGG